MKINKLLVLGLCSCLLLTGCGKIAKLKNGEEAVVTVNKVNITADELYNKLKDKYAKSILVDLIDTAILDKKYPTDDSVKEQVDSQISSIKSQTGEANFLSAIQSQWGFMDEAELYSYLALNVKRNEAVTDYLKSKVTDAEIQTYYDTKTVGDIKASHILIKPKTTSTMTDAEKTAKETEALNKAKDIIKELDGGAKFDDLAKKYSDDAASASKGGDLGWFNKGVMDSNFEAAAYDLKKGEYSKEPVKSAYGYHIILKTGEKDKPKLSEAKTSIIEAIVKNALASDPKLTYTTLENIRKENKLDIKDSDLKAQYDAYMTALESSSTSSN